VRSSDDRLWYLGIGPIAAILLGVALLPLRDVTTASNLAFAFLALTIVVGEAGGRWAATATALASALSLNFFLTRPYLTLTIHGRDDVIAFLGLTACGLISATLGSGRAERLAGRRQLEVLHAALRQLELGGPPESRLQEVLDSVWAAFPVAAIAVRDEGGSLLASAGDRATSAGSPTLVAETEMLAPGPIRRRLSGPAPLPLEGLRLPLVVGRRPLGGLDLWGDGTPAGRETRRTLWAVARVVAALNAEGRRPPSAAGTSERAPSAWVALSHGGPRE
jgi:hypothetical protein